MQVMQIKTDLQQFQEEARKFNSREVLFGLPTTDYQRLLRMVKDFMPFSNLWLTSTNWFKNKQLWLYDDWDKLDAVEVNYLLVV